MIKFVKEQVLMTATAQNIKRMVKLLSRKGPRKEAVAAIHPINWPLLEGILKFFAWLFSGTKEFQLGDGICSAKT